MSKKTLGFFLFFFCCSFILSTADAQKNATNATIEKTKDRLIVLGDSLTEGYGIPPEKAYPALLQKKFDQFGKDIEVINAGISGSTSSSGLGRLQWHLKQKPKYLLLALGANDGLRGVDPKVTDKNLRQVITKAKESGMTVILAGMRMPPNYGPKYTKDFEQIFSTIAKDQKLTFIPFLLDGVAGNKDLNLADGIHPNEKGHLIIVETVFKYLKEVL